MGMSRRERRVLRRISRAERRTDPQFASMLEHGDSEPGTGGAKKNDDRASTSPWAPGSYVPLILF